MRIDTFKYSTSNVYYQQPPAKDDWGQQFKNFLGWGDRKNKYEAEIRSNNDKWFLAITAQVGDDDTKGIGLNIAMMRGTEILQGYAEGKMQADLAVQRIVEDWGFNLKKEVPGDRAKYAPESFLAVAGNPEEVIILQYGAGEIYYVDNETPRVMKPDSDFKHSTRGFGNQNIVFSIRRRPIASGVLLFTGAIFSATDVGKIVNDFNEYVEQKRMFSPYMVRECLKKKFEQNKKEEYCVAGYWVSGGTQDYNPSYQRDGKGNPNVQQWNNSSGSGWNQNNSGSNRKTQDKWFPPTKPAFGNDASRNNQQNVQSTPTKKLFDSKKELRKRLDAMCQEQQELQSKLNALKEDEKRLDGQYKYITQNYQKRMDGMENTRAWIDGIASRNPDYKRDSSQS